MIANIGCGFTNVQNIRSCPCVLLSTGWWNFQGRSTYYLCTNENTTDRQTLDTSPSTPDDWYSSSARRKRPVAHVKQYLFYLNHIKKIFFDLTTWDNYIPKTKQCWKINSSGKITPQPKTTSHCFFCKCETATSITTTQKRSAAEPRSPLSHM
jgi:hypothetical protein